MSQERALFPALSGSLVIFVFLSLIASQETFAENGPSRNGFLPKAQVGFRATKEAKRYRPVCSGLRISGADELELTDMERRLLCGDPGADTVGLPWARIPPNQAGYFLSGFLQARGYHQPSVLQDEELLFVEAGPMSRLENFHLQGGPSGWEPPRKRLVKGLSLTPSLLDELQTWSLEQVRNEGYPCSNAEAQADPVTGVAYIRLESGERKRITGIQDVGDTGLRPGVLDRYNAFRVGDWYREYLVTLTRYRIQDDGILRTVAFTTQCEDQGVSLIRDIVHGPSRVARIGIGGSTEEGAKFRAVLRRNRIGESASTAQFRLNINYLRPDVNRQIMDGSFRWYYSVSDPRRWLEPALLFERAVEEDYESQDIEAKFLHAWSRELATGQYEVRAGPNLLWSVLSRGFGPERTLIGYLEAGVRWITHDFEYFISSPRKGGRLETSLLLTQREWGSSFTAQKWRLNGHKLWNIYRFDPPLLILAVRFDVGSVFTWDQQVSSNLPVRFLTFLGGDENLRGFDRQSLPISGVGALSGAYLGSEARLHRVIFRRADVFAFLDGASLGKENFRLERPIFASSGLGFRWESPLGVFRAYAARRFALEEDPATRVQRQWHFGLTYGEEF